MTHKKKETGRKMSRYRMRGLRVALVILFSMLIFCATAGTILLVRFGDCVSGYQTNMNEILKNVRYSYKNEQTRKDAQMSFDNTTHGTQVYLISRLLKEADDDMAKLEEISNSLGKGKIFVENQNHSYVSFDNEKLSITDDQKEKLIAQGNWSIRDASYWYLQEDEWNIILRFDNDKSIEKRDLFVYAGENETLMIVDSTKDRIIRTNREEMKGKSYSSFIGEKYSENYFYRVWENNENCEHKSGLCNSRDGFLLYEELIPENTDETVIFSVQIPIRQIVSETIRNTFPQLLMIFLVFVLLTVYTVKLFWTGRPLYYHEKKQKISKKWHIDRGYASHISGFLIFGVIISIMVSSYIQLLIDYSTQNMRAEYNLKEAASLVQTTKDDASALEKHYMDSFVDSLVLLSDMISVDKEILNKDSLLDMAKTMHAEEITVFDEKGVSVASSTGYVGYRLSYEEDSPDRNCRELMNDGRESLTWKVDAGGDYYAAARRKDQAGIIRCIASGNELKGLTEKLTLEEAIACANFDEADKIYVDLEEPQNAYIIEANGFTQSLLKDPLSAELLGGQYTGRTTINGRVYYINEVIDNNLLLISASRESNRWTKFLFGIMFGVAGYLLLLICILLLTAIHKTGHFGEDEPEKKEIQKENRGFMRMLRLFMMLIVILLVVLVIVEMRFYSNSVLKYLFSNKWEKTFNLFSITMILIFTVAANVISGIIQKVILLIVGNTGSRGITIGHMFCSLIKFGTLLAVVIFALVQFGAKLSYLLTGAGVIGVVIGYACQGVLNDLLSGLFIVFEGNFQVGDWISVDDWRGEVKEIGVRTTTVAKGGDIRIFNNSCLSKITVWSPSMSGALCLVNVAYEEDLDRVIQIIEQNESRYRAACPHIMRGPGVHGVTELGDSGITIRIWAGVDKEDNVGSTERLMLKETKKIFDENGIVIPFLQVVVHEPAAREMIVQESGRSETEIEFSTLDIIEMDEQKDSADSENQDC